jgi:hypothetical protein
LSSTRTITSAARCSATTRTRTLAPDCVQRSAAVITVSGMSLAT